MNVDMAIKILQNDWEDLVRNYRYQNPDKLDREDALDFAIHVLKTEKAKQDSSVAIQQAERIIAMRDTLKPFAYIGEKYKNYIPAPNSDDVVIVKMKRIDFLKAYEAIIETKEDNNA